MNKKTIKKTFEQLLQYGWMWGHPKYIDKEGWNNLKEFYKTELNSGKDYKPDENNKATVT
tara:strand:+ start:1106 stop:1285 length:180 start_codon:yes stop_codon:yes gene_type:complete